MQAYLNIGESEKALDAFQKKLEYIPMTAEDAKNLETCYVALGNNAEADKYCQKSKQLGFTMQSLGSWAGYQVLSGMAAHNYDSLDANNIEQARAAFQKLNNITGKRQLACEHIFINYISLITKEAEAQSILDYVVQNIQDSTLDKKNHYPIKGFWRFYHAKPQLKNLAGVKALKDRFYRYAQQKISHGHYQEAFNVCFICRHDTRFLGLLEETSFLHAIQYDQVLLIAVEGDQETLGERIQPRGFLAKTVYQGLADRATIRELDNLNVNKDSELYKSALSQVEHAAVAIALTKAVEDKKTWKESQERAANVAPTPQRVPNTGQKTGSASCARDDDDLQPAATAVAPGFDSHATFIEAERAAKTNGYALPVGINLELEVGTASGGSGSVQILYELTSSRTELARYHPHMHYNFNAQESKAILWQYHLLQKQFKEGK